MISKRGFSEQEFGRTGVEVLSVAAGNLWSQLLCLSSTWSCFLVLYSITCTGGCHAQRTYTTENDNVVLVQSNNAGQQTMICNALEENSLQCLNGGSCFLVRDEDNYGFGRPSCSCTSGWTGETCELRFIDQALWAVHHSRTLRANILAGFSTGVLLLCVGGLALIVYLRYRKKQWLSADRLFKATAEELYRRPFNGRSSVVESLSRISSLRRTANSACFQATEEKEPEQVPTDGMEISIQVECIQSADGQWNDRSL